MLIYKIEKCWNLKYISTRIDIITENSRWTICKNVLWKLLKLYNYIICENYENYDWKLLWKLHNYLKLLLKITMNICDRIYIITENLLSTNLLHHT